MAKAGKAVSSMGAMGAFLCGRACSDTLFHVINRAFAEPLKPEERAAQSFAGGIVQHGYQCGMIWGAVLAAGAEAYRRYGAGAEAEARAVAAAERVVGVFRARNNTINCLEITELDHTSTTLQMIVYFLIKGGTVGCFRMAGDYAPVAFDEITAAFSEPEIHVPGSPVSCAAMVAKKAGLSDLHTTMVAGLAGGVGLSGGACGALGAAIWMVGLKAIGDGSGKIKYKDQRTLHVIDKFIKRTDYEFECSDIVGRKFKNTEDHAGYLRNSGCADLIELLAAVGSQG